MSIFMWVLFWVGAWFAVGFLSAVILTKTGFVRHWFWSPRPPCKEEFVAIMCFGGLSLVALIIGITVVSFRNTCRWIDRVSTPFWNWISPEMVARQKNLVAPEAINRLSEYYALLEEALVVARAKGGDEEDILDNAFQEVVMKSSIQRTVGMECKPWDPSFPPRISPNVNDRSFYYIAPEIQEAIKEDLRLVCLNQVAPGLKLQRLRSQG